MEISNEHLNLLSDLHRNESFRNTSLLKTPMLIPKLPVLGSLEIDNLDEFLDKSKIDFKSAWDDTSISEVTIYDFKITKILGQGTFGKVVLGTYKETGMEYAIKIQDKDFILEHLLFESLVNEKKSVSVYEFPFFVPLDFFFLDFKYLYLVMPFIRGGEFYQYLVDVGGRISEEDARFYSSQIVLGLEYLHYLGLAHRDLKPENILLDRTGYIKITDFGLCKKVRGRTWSHVGTAYYMAPEILLNNGYDSSVDWWALGVIIYEMIYGQPPFIHNDSVLLYEMIKINEFYAAEFFSKSLISLLKKLMTRDPTKRLGNLKRKAKDVKEHKWFRTTDWYLILNRKVKAPYIPVIDVDNPNQDVFSTF